MAEWNDNLDDFERQLAADKDAHKDETNAREERRHHHHHHHRKHEKSHRSSRHHRDDKGRNEDGHRSHRSSRHHRDEEERDEDGHRIKRRRRSHDQEDDDAERRQWRRHGHEKDAEVPRDGSRRRGHDREEGLEVEREPEDRMNEGQITTPTKSPPSQALKRDAWMEAPSAIDIEYKHKSAPSAPQPIIQPSSRSPRAELDSKLHSAELKKHHLQEEPGDSPDDPGNGLDTQPASHSVDYEIGDSGSRWRMTRLRGVYRQAEESGLGIEETAKKQYGDLRLFDDAREEELELDRRERYGEGYVGKTKPSGELFQERKLDAGIRGQAEGMRRADYESGIGDGGVVTDREGLQVGAEDRTPRIETTEEKETVTRSVALDSTALNRLRARMMRAKLKGLPEAEALEREYEEASRATQSRPADGVVVLGTMDNRMLAGGRAGEVKDVNNRRGRERGNVEENEDMSIDDMVREERRTKGLFGNEGERLAERIAKDTKFDNDLDYMDENATKLAKRVHKSDTALRNSAIANHKLTNSVLASCPLCHHEDRPADPLPTAPTVSMGHRSYLTLATTPEISPHGCAVIVPIAHHKNLLHCDDDEWEEMRNFQKSLVRMFHARDLGVLFYENAAHPRKQRHAALVAVAVPLGLADDAPAFFREAILAADDEWTQHRKLISTTGKGKRGFRAALSKEVPYFHVWTDMDGGMGHVVEDDRRWPQGDLFAREVLGGMLRVKPETWRRQGRWERGAETVARVEQFRKGWRAYDWTRMLVEGGEAV